MRFFVTIQLCNFNYKTVNLSSNLVQHSQLERTSKNANYAQLFSPTLSPHSS